MPLDQTNWKPETETKPDLSKPSLEGLSWLLRHMPADHSWDFAIVGGRKQNGCGSAGCAMGLLEWKWPGTRILDDLNIEPRDAIHFFGAISYDVPAREVTPSMVADRIDEFLHSRNRDAYLAETRK